MELQKIVQKNGITKGVFITGTSIYKKNKKLTEERKENYDPPVM